MIREYNEGDLEALIRLHAESGFDYAFPNLRDPLFVSKLVLTEERGQPRMAALARLTCEMYLLIDRNASGAAEIRRRHSDFVELHGAGENDLRRKGLEDAHAWLPPPIARRFGRRLESMGWVRDDRWAPYCRRLRD